MVCEQLSCTNCHKCINWDDAFAFIFPNGVVKQLKMKLKPTQNFSTGGIAFGSGSKTFFIGNSGLLTFLMMGRVRWQNRPDNAFLRLLYTLLFSIAKTLACLSEAMNCSLIPILSLYWWSPSTLSLRGTVSLASKTPPTFSFDPRSTNQEQRNCPNSSLQAAARQVGAKRGPSSGPRSRPGLSKTICSLAIGSCSRPYYE